MIDSAIEKTVIGTMIMDPLALETGLLNLTVDCFSIDWHRKMFTSMKHLSDLKQTVDPVMLAEHSKVTFEDISLAMEHSVSSIETHCKKLKELFNMRILHNMAMGVQSMTQNGGEYNAITESIEKALNGLCASNDDYVVKHIKESVQPTFEALEGKNDLNTPIHFGFPALDTIVGGIFPGEFVVIGARPGMGKCLGKGTNILMYDGSLKKVEEIKVGDELMGDDSKPRNVLSLARGREEMYWVRQKHGIDYRVNKSHILSLMRSTNIGKHKHGEILNIEVSDYVEKSDHFKSNYKGYKVDVKFKKVDTELEPYFLGLWLGDGNSRDVRIHNPDIEIDKYLRGYAERVGLEFKAVYPKDRCKYMAITGDRGGNTLKSYSIQKILNSIGVLRNKHIPNNYLINSKKNRLSLLAGLLDTDGYLCESKRGYEIVQVREGLARQIKSLCDSLGYKTSFRKKKTSIKSTGFEGVAYAVTLYGNVDEIPLLIERKKALPRRSKIDWKCTGIDVSYDKVDDYYGFEIDGNHLFLLEDMTVTHNTAFLLNAIMNMSKLGQKSLMFSLEMKTTQLVTRYFASEAEINSNLIRNRKLVKSDYAKLASAADVIYGSNIYVNSCKKNTVHDIRAIARRHVRNHPDTKCIVIDYIQLIRDSKEFRHDKRLANEEKSLILCELAAELNIPIISLAQLSRNCESRNNKRPMPSDIKEAGQIEQDAHIMGFLYRGYKYGDTYQDANNNAVDYIETDVDFILSKNREGMTGTVRLTFKGEYSKFYNVDAVQGEQFTGKKDVYNDW